MKIKKTSFLLLLLPLAVWTFIVLASLETQLSREAVHQHNLATERSRNMFQIIEIARLWNAEHGGVYVPVSEKTPPNPYLMTPDRDVTTTQGLALTKINPAYMTREIAELAIDRNVLFNITSLKPLNPDNLADEWEANALLAFERGEWEVSELQDKGEQPLFRFMAALRTEKACLKCHAAQGYEEGEIRGGISVTLPAAEIVAHLAQHRAESIGIHGITWLLVSALIFAFLRKQQIHLRHLDIMRRKQAKQLELRTRELRRSNAQLSQIIDHAPYPIMVHADDGSVISINERWVELTGYNHEAISDIAAWTKLAYGEKAENISEVIGSLFDAEGFTHEGEYTVRDIHGNHHVWDFHSATLGEQSDGRRLLISMANDITTLRQTEKERDRILRYSKDMICTATFEGYFRFINPAWVNTTGYSVEELTNRPFLEFIHPQDREATIEAMSVLSEGRSVTDFINRYITKDGKDIWLSWRSTPDLDNSLIYAFARDITETKLAQDALIAAEERYHTLYDLSPFGVLIIDDNFQVIEFNRIAHEQLGYSREEYARLGIPGLEAKFNLKEQRSLFNELVRDGYLKFDTKHHHKNGELRDIRVECQRVDMGDSTFYYTINQDITEEKQAAEALVAAEERYRTLFELSPDGVLVINELGHATEFNLMAHAQLGYSREEFAKLNLGEIEVNESPEEIRAHMETIMQHGRDDFETLHRCKDGELRNVLVTTQWLELGGEKAFYTIFRDITQQKREQQEIRHYTDRFKLAAKAGGIGVWEWDVNSGKLRWDDRMFELYQKDPADFHGSYEDWHTSLHPEDRAQVEQAIEQAIQSTPDEEANFDSEFRIRLPNGSERAIRAMALIEYDNHNNPGRVVGVNYDISQRKQYESLLKQAKNDAELASRAKSQFLANMSHEIRTPMNAILGLAHLTLETSLTPKQHDNLEKILISSRSLLGIINDILEYSKIEAGRLELSPVPFELSELFAELAVLHNLSANEKRIKLSFNREEELPNHLVGDNLRLKQVLSNLISNALKFTAQGEVRCSAQLSEADEETAVINFSVEDTGIGIGEEDIAKLFQPFSQVDNSTSRHYGGTGLGLSISKRLVNMMGGELSVVSTMEKGSCFEFSARFGTDLTNAPEAPSTIELIKQMQVIIVNASEHERQQLSAALESLRMNYQAVESCESALHILSALEEQDNTDNMLLIAEEFDDKEPLIRQINSRIKEEGKNSVYYLTTISSGSDYDVPNNILHHGAETVLSLPATVSQLYESLLTAAGDRRYTDLPITPQMRAEGLRAISGSEILLVEDNALNQQVAIELLQKLHMQVSSVDNGEDAIEQVEHKLFDLVLMDIQMPGIDGYETTRRIRSTIPENQLPIVAMTAHAMSSDRDNALKAGMNDHMAKPIEPTLLEEMLLRWIPARITPDMSIQHEEQQEPQRTAKLPRSLPGIDMATGLRRLGSDTDLYRRTLLRFHDEYRTKHEHIEKLHAEAQWQELRRFAHTLKGASGIIGAEELSQAAAELESTITEENEEQYAKQKASLLEQLARIMATLDENCPNLNSNEKATTSIQDRSEVLDKIDMLDELLRINDVDAIDKGESLRMSLAELVDAELTNSFYSQLDSFDMAAARESLGAIRSALQQITE